MTDQPRVRLPLLRGSTEHADCLTCPFSTNGEPTRPVMSEFPADPAFIVIGEGPGFNETRLGRPFIGESGKWVDKLLATVGRPRPEVFVGNATLCQPYSGADVNVRERAAACCKPRLLAELAQFPGKPVLTLGAVAARAVIPAEELAKIDPPETPKQLKKAQKMRSQPSLKHAMQRRKAISKAAKRRLAKMLKHHRNVLITECKVKHRRRPDEKWLQQEILRVQPRLERKAGEDAIKEVDLAIRERAAKKLIDATKPKKPKKPKPIKITDIVGTLFEVDIDGTGIRPLIPGIHPAALLRGGGGGGGIAGSHAADMGYINLKFDFAKINDLAKGRDIRLKIDVEYELADPVRTQQLFLEFYQEAFNEGAFSLDLETYVEDEDRHHALMMLFARIRVIGLSVKRPGLPTRAISLSWDLLPPVCQTLLQVMISKLSATYHNGLYDRTVLMAYGYSMGDRWFDGGDEVGWDDTLLAHHAAFPGNSHKLQTVGAQFFGVPAWKSEFRNAEESPEKLAKYNALDTGVTHELRAPLDVWIKRTKTERVYDLDRKMSTCASHMHLAGMPVDREINSELLRTFSKNVVESRRAVEDIARDPKLRDQIWHYLALGQARKQRKLDPPELEERYNLRLAAMRLDPDWKWKIGSGKHIAALLQTIGVQLTATTAGGDISTQKEVLESLVEVEVVRHILTYRENDKLYSTFVAPMFDRTDDNGQIISYGFADEDDRIHPIPRIHLISGRWATSWPVTANVPKDKWLKLRQEQLMALGIMPDDKKFQIGGIWYRINKDNTVSKMVRPNLRRQIKCRPGRRLVGFDFGQIEARVIALVSGDPFLCAVFADPTRDIHNECAAIIWKEFWQLDPDTRKQLRENVKNIEYGAMYMAQLDTLHATMLKAGNMIKKADLAVAIRKLLTAMAGVVRWQQAAIRRAMQPPFEARDFILGRRRVWPMGQAEGPEIVNFEVQPTAAALMNQGMARMFPKLFKYREAYLINQIHDAAVFEIWEDDVEPFKRDVHDSFATEIERNGLLVKFPIDMKDGESWDQV